jgi:hypothetical protein
VYCCYSQIGYTAQYSRYSLCTCVSAARADPNPIVDKYARLVIGHPMNLNSTTKIAHHATATRDIKTGQKNINKIIVRKNLRVAKITIGKLVPTKIGK